MANRNHCMAHGLMVWTRACCIALVGIAVGSGYCFAQVASQQSMIGSWLVTVQGDARTRILTVNNAPQTDESTITLAASYGWIDGNQAPIKAVLRKAERSKLEIVTDADSTISVEQVNEESFIGKFQPKTGAARSVKVERLSAVGLSKLLNGLARASQPCTGGAVATGGAQATQMSANEPAPILQTGDCWAYQVRDMYTGSELHRFEVFAIASGQEGTFFHVKRNERVTRLVQTSELNALQKYGEKESDSGNLRFPLAVGKKWKSLTYYREADGTLGKLEFDREVLSFEKVKVLAGEFDAFKIVAKGNWTIIENPKGWNDTYGRAERTYWYAPGVKRFVLFEYRQYARGHQPPWEREELIGFNVQ